MSLLSPRNASRYGPSRKRLETAPAIPSYIFRNSQLPSLAGTSPAKPSSSVSLPEAELPEAELSAALESEREEQREEPPEEEQEEPGLS